MAKQVWSTGKTPFFLSGVACVLASKATRKLNVVQTPHAMEAQSRRKHLEEKRLRRARFELWLILTRWGKSEQELPSCLSVHIIKMENKNTDLKETEYSIIFASSFFLSLTFFFFLLPPFFPSSLPFFLFHILPS